MPTEFKQFIRAEVATMVRDIGEDACGDVERLNERAIEWVRKNAVRFRNEWCRRRGQALDVANEVNG